MERINFEKLKADDRAIKFSFFGKCLFIDKRNDSVLEFGFFQNGLTKSVGIPPASRILLTIFPLSDLHANIKSTDTISFDERVDILVNADSYDYASHYILTHHAHNRTVELKLIEGPELGKAFITEEEQIGIIRHY